MRYRPFPQQHSQERKASVCVSLGLPDLCHTTLWLGQRGSGCDSQEKNAASGPSRLCAEQAHSRRLNPEIQPHRYKSQWFYHKVHSSRGGRERGRDPPPRALPKSSQRANRRRWSQVARNCTVETLLPRSSTSTSAPRGQQRG